MKELIKGTTKLLLSVVTLCTIASSIIDASSEVKTSAKVLKDVYKASRGSKLK